MAELDKERRNVSFAMSDALLREQAPPSLLRAGPLREEFVAANDHAELWRKKTIDDELPTKGDERSGSQMVKRQKPFPELKPSYADCVKRNTFNQDWIREQRAEKIHQFKTQRQIAPQQKRCSEPSFER